MSEPHVIMLEPCAHCYKEKAEHMPDGSCLFEPTKFKKLEYVFRTHTGRLSGKAPNISNMPRPDALPHSWLSEFTSIFKRNKGRG